MDSLVSGQFPDKSETVLAVPTLITNQQVIYTAVEAVTITVINFFRRQRIRQISMEINSYVGPLRVENLSTCVGTNLHRTPCESGKVLVVGSVHQDKLPLRERNPSSSRNRDRLRG